MGSTSGGRCGCRWCLHGAWSHAPCCRPSPRARLMHWCLPLPLCLSAIPARINRLCAPLILPLLLPPCRRTMGQRELRDAFQRVYDAATQVLTFDAVPYFVWCIIIGCGSIFGWCCAVGWLVPPRIDNRRVVLPHRRLTHLICLCGCTPNATCCLLPLYRASTTPGCAASWLKVGAAVLLLGPVLSAAARAAALQA